jgi:hypothetical protein
VRRGYASYNPAYCITYESGERIVVSQPWNERFASHPLPYIDEVRFAADVAWILRPADDFGMPSPERFEGLLRTAGGTWRRTDQGGFVIYHSFVAPFPDLVAEATVRLCNEALTLPLSPPRTLSGITLVARADRPLPDRLMVETATDDERTDLVWSRRRPRALTKLVWLNGNPRFAIDPNAVAVTIHGDEPVARVRVTTTGADACAAIGPVLLHGRPGGRTTPETPLIDRSWSERRQVLAEEPRPDSAGWHYRRLVAEEHR